MKAVGFILLIVILGLAALSIWQPRSSSEDSKMQTDSSAMPTENKIASPRGPLAPDIVSDTWLNSPVLAAADLRGKVVVVEFWTFDCINCRNTLPSVKNWYNKYRDQGLVVIGVHSPEFDYEHDVVNVQRAIKDLGIAYPVMLDNDFKNWKAYNVWAWPTWYVLDKQGTIRFSHVGEGAYDETERTIAALLKE